MATEEFSSWQDFRDGMSFTFATGEDHEIKIRRETIPIIVLPGVMGTKLKNRDGTKAWDPSDTSTAFDFLFSGAGSRSSRFNDFMGEGRGDGSHTSVDMGEKDDVSGLSRDEEKLSELRWSLYHQLFTPKAEYDDLRKKIASSKERRYKRGWTSILLKVFGSDIYGGLLDHIERTFDVACGAGGSFSRYFLMPVHVVGYNWAGSNGKAGEYIAEQVEDVIKTYNEDPRTYCEGCILVTHSMGGIASRAAMCLSGLEEKVFGAVHCVEPTEGAPAAYKRMRAGFEAWDESTTFWPLSRLKEGAMGKMLGNTSELVTAILATSPGPLELLPTPQLEVPGGGNQWLHLTAVVDKEIRVLKNLPESDPYRDIYLQRHAFWRLVNPDEIIPDDIVPKGKTLTVDQKWAYFEEAIGIAKTFREELSGKFHPNTYAIWGADEESAGCKAWARVEHRILGQVTERVEFIHNSYQKREVIKPMSSAEFSEMKAAFTTKVPDVTSDFAVVKHDELDCDFRFRDRIYRARLQPKRDGGDGTVPILSGGGHKLAARDANDIPRRYALTAKKETSTWEDLSDYFGNLFESSEEIARQEGAEVKAEQDHQKAVYQQSGVWTVRASTEDEPVEHNAILNNEEFRKRLELCINSILQKRFDEATGG